MKASEQMWSYTLEENPEENEATLERAVGVGFTGVCAVRAGNQAAPRSQKENEK